MSIERCKTLLVMAMAGWLLIGLGVLPAVAATPNLARVELHQQDASGQIVANGAKGQLVYDLAGPRFKFVFTAYKLDKSTSYSLILSREPEVMLPARYEVIATGTSNSRGGLNLFGSFEFNMDLLAGRILLIPTTLSPAEALTDAGKYLFATGTIAYDDTESELVCGANQSPGPSDQAGLQAGDPAIDFSLYGIAGPGALTAGNAEQPLTLFTLSELLQSAPVLLVNGAFT